MLPYLLFVCLAAQVSATLHAPKSFQHTCSGPHPVECLLDHSGTLDCSRLVWESGAAGIRAGGGCSGRRLVAIRHAISSITPIWLSLRLPMEGHPAGGATHNDRPLSHPAGTGNRPNKHPGRYIRGVDFFRTCTRDRNSVVRRLADVPPAGRRDRRYLF